MTSREIRQQFLDFFASRRHAIVESAPVVPLDDPTLMFTNAGMNQFKDVFLGTGTRSYRRAADTQKCIRAGGKHNDLDDVGQDTYHHTFFEMLGNWSFGDYFKKDAIQWAWELLTGVWGIDKQRLHATYFEGDAAEGLEPDTEAAELWRTVTDILPDHVHPGNKKDNFWEMGDTGPCGPCSEIHIDLTPDRSGRSLVNRGDARVMELWNLVFIQFNRASDGQLTPLPARHVDTGMGFERLCAVLQGKKSNYDTDVFTPLFETIRKRTAAPPYMGTLPGGASAGSAARTDDEGPAPVGSAVRTNDDEPTTVGSAVRTDQVMVDVSYRVIADHLRCLTFALTDGAMPSNEGRGYVLRRILRRAVRYGRQYLDMHEPFLCDLVPALVDHMGEAFPELHTAHGGRNVHHVSEIIRDEEAGFMRTLGRGLRLASAVFSACAEARAYSGSPTYNRASVRSAITRAFAAQTNVRAVSPRGWSDLSPAGEVFEETQQIGRLRTLVTDEVLDAILATPGTVPGEIAFTLHDTYGFPIDLTEQMALERGLTVDFDSYGRRMDEARERARPSTARANPMIINDPRYTTDDSSKYDALDLTTLVNIKGHELSRGPQGSYSFSDWVRGAQGQIVLKETCFYAEQGGQIGDRGTIEGDGWVFEVRNTLRGGSVVVHVGALRSGVIPASLGHPIRAIARVSPAHRIPTMQNHTATHLLNWALREVLCAAEERENPHVQQRGSLVDPDKTRFDFSHNKPLTDDEISRIDALVNERIAADLPVYAASREEHFVDQKLARRINTLRAVFGEKYPDKVRVVSIGAPITEEDARAAGEPDWLLKSPKDPRWMDYSVEFCGGTHVPRTAEIQDFVLVAEESVAKGIRRVVGITGEKAGNARSTGEALLKELDALGSPQQSRDRKGAGKPNLDRERATIPCDADDAPAERPRGLKPAAQGDLPARLAAFQQRFADADIPVLVRSRIRAKLEALQQVAKEHAKHDAAQAGEAVRRRVKEFLAEGHVVSGIAVVVGEVPEAPVDALRGAVDWVRNRTPSSAVLLAICSEGKVTLLAGMSRDVVERGLKAGDLIREVAPLVGGKGGGRPDMAQGGGTDPSALPAALERARAWIVGKLR